MDKVSYAVTLFWMMVSFACFVSFKNLEISNHEYLYTCQVIDKAQETIKNMIETENYHRNYVLIGKQEYRDRYNNSKIKVLPSLSALAQITSKTQNIKLQNAEKIAIYRLDVLANTLKIYDQQGFAAAQKDIETTYQNCGITKMTEFKILIEEIMVEEQRMLNVREATNKSRFRSVELCIYGAIAVSLIFFLLPMLNKLRGLIYGSN